MTKPHWRAGVVLFMCFFFLITLGAQQWSERGPVIGGRLSAIVAADGGTTLVVARRGGGGWRSADAGRSWRVPPNSGGGALCFVHRERDFSQRRTRHGPTR